MRYAKYRVIEYAGPGRGEIYVPISKPKRGIEQALGIGTDWYVSDVAIVRALRKSRFVESGDTTRDIIIDGDDRGVLFVYRHYSRGPLSKTRSPLYRLEFQQLESGVIDLGMENPLGLHPLARYNEPNPLSPSTETYVIAGIGIALAAGIGLWLYTKSQANQVGTISSGPQSTTLGPGGSTTPLGSAASGTYTGGLNPDTPFVNAPGPQGPMSGPLPSPGA